MTLVDTGEQTQTGGRLRRVMHYVGDEEFCFTYGDGVSSIDIGELIRFHREQDVMATVTAVQPPGPLRRARQIEDERVHGFRGEAARRRRLDQRRLLRPVRRGSADYIDGDDTVWEREPMERLAARGSAAPYKYDGFWHPMDTLRDKMYLEELWSSGRAPWKKWE